MGLGVSAAADLATNVCGVHVRAGLTGPTIDTYSLDMEEWGITPRPEASL